MENDLISRSALKKALLERSFYPAIVKAALENAPAVDAVEVVRCKDCKFGIVSLRNPLVKWCNKHATQFRDNDFCSYGERRGD